MWEMVIKPLIMNRFVRSLCMMDAVLWCWNYQHSVSFMQKDNIRLSCRQQTQKRNANSHVKLPVSIVPSIICQVLYKSQLICITWPWPWQWTPPQVINWQTIFLLLKAFRSLNQNLLSLECMLLVESAIFPGILSKSAHAFIHFNWFWWVPPNCISPNDPAQFAIIRTMRSCIENWTIYRYVIVLFHAFWAKEKKWFVWSLECRE